MGHALTDLSGNAQESRLILLTVIHARDHGNTQDAGTLRHSWRRGGESRVRQGISNDCDFLGREACGNQPISGGLRVADHGVTPAEGSGLRAELRGGQQVSELAMTSDDNRHAGKPGCGNKGEVGIEIEGVGDLHMMLPQMAAQVKARAQRPPSIEAAAERKFGDVREIVGERANVANAADMRLKLWGRKILGEDGELALGPSRFKTVDHKKQPNRRMGRIELQTVAPLSG
jgi:hypothetical protein